MCYIIFVIMLICALNYKIVQLFKLWQLTKNSRSYIIHKNPNEYLPTTFTVHSLTSLK